MADITMEKFLKKYYKQLHFNSMPKETWTRFEEWRKNGTLTDDMQHWVRDYMTQNATGAYVRKDLPDPSLNSDLPEEEARNLFIAFQNAFAGMSADVNIFKDKDPQSAEFVNRYFGAGKLFDVSPAKPECAKGIDAIINLIKTDAQVQRIVLDAETRDDEGKTKKLFANSGKLNEFITKCENKKYNSDGSVQSKIQKVAKALENATLNYYGTPVANKIEEIHDPHLNNVMDNDAFSMAPQSIDSTKLQNFRNLYAKNPNGLLQTLYKNKTIRNRFANYDNGAITGPIGSAEKDVNYQDKSSENYVDPKFSDVLTPLQQIEKWASDTYDDTIKKYEELRGGTLFFKQEAKDIFKAIDSVKIGDKKGIKPSDGLDALLKNKDAIADKIDNPVAKQHFKWFTETMEPISKSMPKAIAGAWNNARQMKAVISRIIMEATKPDNNDPHAIEKAKTAMEIMTAMKYGMMTSKVMDAMKQTDFNIFSDGKLSWNKNEGIQFVTKAFDQSVKAAFLGIGYSVTFARNKIMMSGMKFKDQNNQEGGLLNDAFKKEQERLTSKRSLDQQDTADKNNADQTRINNNNTILRQLATRNNINSTNIDAKEQQVANYKIRLDNYQSQMSTYKQRMESYQTAHDEYIQNKTIVDEYNNLPAEIARLSGDKTTKLAEIRKLRKAILDPNTYADPLTGLRMGEEEKKEKEAELTQQLKTLQQEYTSLDTELTDKQNKNTPAYYNATVVPAQNLIAPGSALARRNAIYENAETRYNNIEARYNALQSRYDSLDGKTKQFREATTEIQELTQAITDRNNAMQTWPDANKNKVVELENYWNWLQSGDTKTWRLSQKNAQKDFDTRKQVLLQQYVSQHGLAA